MMDKSGGRPRRARYRHRRIQTPRCPFCESKVKRPVLSGDEIGSDFAVGSCSCGALYACDSTGKKQGAALMELLFLLAGGDSEAALRLTAGKDYEKKAIVDYHERIHQVTVGPVLRRRKIFSDSGLGVLLFLKRIESAQ